MSNSLSCVNNVLFVLSWSPQHQKIAALHSVGWVIAARCCPWTGGCLPGVPSFKSRVSISAFSSFGEPERVWHSGTPLGRKSSFPRHGCLMVMGFGSGPGIPKCFFSSVESRACFWSCSILSLRAPELPASTAGGKRGRGIGHYLGIYTFPGNSNSAAWLPWNETAFGIFYSPAPG